MPEKFAVIGSGVGGMAVAARLAAKGYRVDVYEQSDMAGGKMSEIRHEGYRFDTGPSLFTAPDLVDELIALCGEQEIDFHYSKLDTICRYFYEDGMVIDASGDPVQFAAELAEKAGEDPGRVMKYLEKSRKIYEFTYPVFIRNSLHRVKNYLTADFIRALFRLHRLNPLISLHQLNRKYFRHPNTVQLFDRYATYNGSDPYKTPSTMRVIPHLEHNVGAFFPREGMYQIIRSLSALSEKLGVRLHLNTRVEEIVLSGNKVSGIRVNGEIIPFDMVVSDADIWFVYRQLLKSLPFREKWFRHERSTSALIFYWGMEMESPQLDMHNILFSADYALEFRHLFELKTLQPDPTVYIFISSKVVKSDAPAGCENWFVMINVPENTGQDWDGIIADARGRIEEKISRLLKIDVSKHRKFEFILDPRGIESRTASYRGSLYGNSSNSMWSAFRRHPNFSDIKGLYFTGGSVHPGGGIPLCLSSAKIVADLIPTLKK
ncbi:MAG: 1-hydroxycarotenoid 3,4-desaturase CrtD [Bacteroidales bacterium]